ncbi:hypothetical protein [Anaerotruncus rubiinfantis]|uniref:hypothetical protein n=1 Tax=Anaerotruncus rubiinfantis TaxID=1720200 RepID=UPI00189C0696|nr:hypothetical protein [Anaerotruncus rubiinfantis]
MTSNIVLKCSGNANKDAVAAILARAITGGNAKAYLCEVSEQAARKAGHGAVKTKIEGNGHNGTSENLAALAGR